MEERQRRAAPRRRADDRRLDLRRAGVVGDQRPVGEHRALGRARGAGGVEQHRESRRRRPRRSTRRLGGQVSAGTAGAPPRPATAAVGSARRSRSAAPESASTCSSSRGGVAGVDAAPRSARPAARRSSATTNSSVLGRAIATRSPVAPGRPARAGRAAARRPARPGLSRSMTLSPAISASASGLRARRPRARHRRGCEVCTLVCHEPESGTADARPGAVTHGAVDARPCHDMWQTVPACRSCATSDSCRAAHTVSRLSVRSAQYFASVVTDSTRWVRSASMLTGRLTPFAVSSTPLTPRRPLCRLSAPDYLRPFAPSGGVARMLRTCARCRRSDGRQRSVTR